VVPPRASGTAVAAPPAANAGAAGATRWRATAFAAANHFSYGVALQRHGADAGACRSASLWLANGNDHVPQFMTRFRVTPGARPDCVPSVAVTGWSSRAMYFADVAAGDIDGNGRDELFLASLADRDGCTDSGGVWRMSDAVASVPAAEALAGGFAAAALALGDVDRDGRMDLVVGTLGAPAGLKARRVEVACDELRAEEDANWLRPPRPDVATSEEDLSGYEAVLGFPFSATRDRTPLRESGCRQAVRHPHDNAEHSPVLVFPGAAKGAPLALPAEGAVDVDLHDVDGDGALDVVAAGRDLRVFYGPISAKGQVRCTQMTLPPGGTSAFLGVDAVDVRGQDGAASHTWIAASAACTELERCNHVDFSVEVWRRARGGAWARRSLAVAGLPSAVRFIDRDGAGAPDLVVGRMTEPVSGESDAPELGERLRIPWLGWLGAPLQVYMGAGGADPWPRWEAETIALVGLRGTSPSEFFPMAFRIHPYANGLAIASGCDGEHRARECEFAGPFARGQVLTYSGPGAVAGVAGVRDARGPLRFHHVDGDDFVTLAAPARGRVEVEWRVSSAPAYVVTSAGPVPGPNGYSLLVSRNRGETAEGEGR
jgi:hypothetical protein